MEGALEQLGLTRREANEFIVYWLPHMEQNPYNIISFQTDAYTNAAELKVSPEPDTLIRVLWLGKGRFVYPLAGAGFECSTAFWFYGSGVGRNRNSIRSCDMKIRKLLLSFLAGIALILNCCQTVWCCDL